MDDVYLRPTPGAHDEVPIDAEGLVLFVGTFVTLACCLIAVMGVISLVMQAYNRYRTGHWNYRSMALINLRLAIVSAIGDLLMFLLLPSQVVNLWALFLIGAISVIFFLLHELCKKSLMLKETVEEIMRHRTEMSALMEEINECYEDTECRKGLEYMINVETQGHA